MAQQVYNIDLTTESFPMLSKQSKRTVIAPNKEDTAVKPGLVYAHNVLPTAYGYNSIGFTIRSVSIPNLQTEESVVAVHTVFSETKVSSYLAITSSGRLFVLSYSGATWHQVTSPIAFTGLVTAGVVKGVTYLYRANVGCYTYNSVTLSMTSVTLAGLIATDIVGISASSGYLLAFTVTDIAWSSTIDPTDFAPSSVTGAGGGSVSDIKGDIVFATANTFGVLIHTKSNVVSCIYTGNATYPFKFKEVENSGGGLSLDLVAYETKSSNQFLYSSSGLQAVNSQRAESILPEVTDFLGGKLFEDFNSSTRQFETSILTYEQTLKKKIKLIQSRYLIISYGITEFTHALVYDTALGKLGKLKTVHTDCFEYYGTQEEIAKQAIAFIAADGKISTVDFSEDSETDGVLLLGKLQGIRERKVVLDKVEIEYVDITHSLQCYDMYTLDGKVFLEVSGSELISKQGLRTFGFRVTGENHSILLMGDFELVTALCTYHNAGHR